MEDITVYDVNTQRLQFIQEEYNVKVSTSVDEAVKGASISILAVKPQNVDSVAQSLCEPLSGLLLSIVAGCTIDKLEKSFKTDKVVRSMPNTPAMVLEAITVWTGTYVVQIIAFAASRISTYIHMYVYVCLQRLGRRMKTC